MCYLMVMTFLQRAESLNGVLMGLAGVTLALSALIAVMPLAIAVFMSNTGPQYVEVPTGEGPAAAVAEEDFAGDFDEVADDFDVAADFEFDDDEFA